MKKRAIVWVAVSTENQASEDKASIETQLASAEKTAEIENWDVVDVMVVRGFSRAYIDIFEFADDLEKAHKNDAGYRLIKHLKDADFDVLWCRDADRLGRGTTLISFVAEYILRNQAEIFVGNDNAYVSGGDSQLRMWMLFKGYESASFTDEMKRKIKMGLDNRINKGLPVGGNISNCFEYIYDDSHKPVGVRIRDGVKEEFKHVARLLIHGDDNGDKVAWANIEAEMFKLGYGRDGRRHPKRYYQQKMMTPMFWGHLGRACRKSRLGFWIFEEGHKVPDGCTMHYNALPHCAIYEGELSVAVRSILKQRMKRRGRARRNPHRYSMLFACYGCMGTMSVMKNKTGDIRYMVCSGSGNNYHHGKICDNTKTTNINLVDAYIEKMILSLTDDDSAYLLEDDSLFQSDHALGVERLESQIEHATKRLANILDLLETSEGTLRELQQARATELGQTLDDLKSTLAELVESQTETTMQLNRRQSSLQDIKAMKLDGYRALSESQKNNLLSALLGNTRIVLSPDGVVGFTRTPRPKTRMY